MKLENYLKSEGISVRRFAAMIGTTEVSVYRYIKGDRVPRPRILAKIVTESRGKVTANDFMLAYNGLDSEF